MTRRILLVAHPRREAIAQSLRDVRARDDDALVDVEPELAEPRLVGQVGRRDPIVDPARKQMRQRLALGLRQPRVEERLQAVERKVQCVQQQIRRLVIRVDAAVPERELHLAETRDRVAQPIAHGFELVGRDRTHGWTPTLAAVAAALPPEGAPWGGPAALIFAPRLSAAIARACRGRWRTAARDPRRARVH